MQNFRHGDSDAPYAISTLRKCRCKREERLRVWDDKAEGSSAVSESKEITRFSSEIRLADKCSVNLFILTDSHRVWTAQWVLLIVN